ncbi:MAG: ATP-binding protein [Phormidesmis sp.]
MRQQERLGKERISSLTDHLGDRADSNKRFYLTVNSRLESLATVQQWFENLLNYCSDLSPAPYFWVGEAFDQLNLALAEGFTNAVRHAHVNLPSHTPIVLECWVQFNQVEIRIFDQGEPFDPDSLVEPQPGTLREGGYGWFLLRRLVDEVTYERAQPDFLMKRLFDSQSVHSTDTYVTPSRADIQQVCNCLKLVKTA